MYTGSQVMKTMLIILPNTLLTYTTDAYVHNISLTYHGMNPIHISNEVCYSPSDA